MLRICLHSAEDIDDGITGLRDMSKKKAKKEEKDMPMPMLPTFLPESHWPQGYLVRIRRELNVFLKLCHKNQKIEGSELYSIFMEPEPSIFKQRRKQFDKKAVANLSEV